LKTACKVAGGVIRDKARNSRGERAGIVFHSSCHARITKGVQAGYFDEIILQLINTMGIKSLAGKK